MSNRDALRKLSKRFPAPPELERLLDGLSDGADYTAAIIGAAIVESFLERVIIARFKHFDNILQGQLFDNKGPLTDFHSKIIVAHAFGVITPSLAGDLHRIKRARNAFAHAKVQIDFCTKEVVDALDFTILAAMNDSMEDKDDLPKQAFKPSKSTYVLCCRVICIMLDDDHRNAGKQPLMVWGSENPKHGLEDQGDDIPFV